MGNAFIYETSIGDLLIAEHGEGITKVALWDEQYRNSFASSEFKETDMIKKAAKQMKEYLDGIRKEFTVPLRPQGTEFQKNVWRALRQIPYGETRSYKQIAEAVGNPKAARAVGMANNKNPILCMIPCHRVIGSNGAMTGFAGGIAMKKTLLEIEKI